MLSIAKSPMVFQRMSGALVKINVEPLEVLLEHRQDGPSKLEAGGILLGRFLRNSANVVVDEVTIPSHLDRQARAFFHRNHLKHQQVIDARWKASNGTCQYLGEWHTHPEPEPTPSHVDMRDWSRRLREDQFHGHTLLFLIVGMREIRAWEGDRRTLAIRPLEFIDLGLSL